MATAYKEYPEYRLAEIHVEGRVSMEDFEDIAGRLEAFILHHGRVRLMEVVRDFDGFDLSILKDAIRFDREHLKDFSHCAVVSDSGWIGPFARMIAPFLNMELRVFGIDQIEDARCWLREAE
ncbi:STAS/SEC14 domain-containing protein [Marinobacter sp. JSM 1782161]|uniref:STAS/SEC14 domain-containing protein n=1 Tax=Marinobacter sp. JSM 1782161 TaxID=2685906 RepID=UPI001401CB1D|nr:STAS/SEC14 domain-containing protein [Marinobacter sp. JSM 1782161]